MTTYRLESKATYWLYAAILPCLFMLGGGLWLWIAVAQPAGSTSSGAPVWFGVLWLACVVWALKRYVTMPHTIEVTDKGSVRFVGAFHTTVVALSEIISVNTFAGQFVYVTHPRGKMLLLHQFSGFHEFITRLKQAKLAGDDTRCMRFATTALTSLAAGGAWWHCERAAAEARTLGRQTERFGEA